MRSCDDLKDCVSFPTENARSLRRPQPLEGLLTCVLRQSGTSPIGHGAGQPAAWRAGTPWPPAAFPWDTRRGGISVHASGMLRTLYCILAWTMSLVWKPFLVVHVECRVLFSWFYFKSLEDSTTCISVLSFRYKDFVILHLGLWRLFCTDVFSLSVWPVTVCIWVIKKWLMGC